MTEQRPRMQSRSIVVPLGQGDGVLFAVHQRPVQGTRGVYRVNLRPGVSRIRSGHRLTRSALFSTMPSGSDRTTEGECPGRIAKGCPRGCRGQEMCCVHIGQSALLALRHNRAGKPVIKDSLRACPRPPGYHASSAPRRITRDGPRYRSRPSHPWQGLVRPE